MIDIKHKNGSKYWKSLEQLDLSEIPEISKTKSKWLIVNDRDWYEAYNT